MEECLVSNQDVAGSNPALRYKKCSTCELKLPTKDFSFKDGKSGRKHSYCKKCLKEYKKEYYLINKDKYRERSRLSRNKRKNIINKFKDKPCGDCGNKYQHCAMQFDHLSDKEFGIAEGLRRFSIEKLTKEIAKCELVCTNCHISRTRARSISHSSVTAKDHRRRYMRQVKSNSCCSDCKQFYPYYMMQFDHLEGKNFTIGKEGYRVGLSILKSEIAKCDIVCANCHAVRSYLASKVRSNI